MTTNNNNINSSSSSKGGGDNYHLHSTYQAPGGIENEVSGADSLIVLRGKPGYRKQNLTPRPLGSWV